MTEACQVSSAGGPTMTPPDSPGVPAPSSQSATRWATPPVMTPPSASEHGDGGAAESAHHRTGVGRPPEHGERDGGEHDDQCALGEDDDAEGTVAGEPAVGDPAGAGPGGVQHGQGQQGERGAGQQGDGGPVELQVEAAFAAAPAADHPDHHGGPREQGQFEHPAGRFQERARGPAVVAGPGHGEGGGDGEEPAAVGGRRGAGRRGGGRTRSRACRGRGASARRGRAGAAGRGRWDSYALQVRWDRYQRRPVSAAGTTAARARRRPGWAHQPPRSGDRKPSHDLSPEQREEPAHCHAVRSSATSQAAAISSTVRLRARSRTSTPYMRTVLVRPRVVGCIQWVRLATMKGSRSSHSARAARCRR